MLRQHLKSILRHLLRHRLHSVLNILGLAAGLSVCLVIGLFVLNEVDFDRFHAEGERIFRLVNEAEFYGLKTLAPTSEKAGPLLRRTYPEVETVVRLSRADGRIIGLGDRLIKSDHVLYADEDFFRLFSFPLFAGDPDRVLVRPHTAVLTRSMAGNLFGDKQALGETFTIDREMFEVTGIAADPPSATHLGFAVVASMATLEPELSYNDWTRFSMFTYVRLRSGTDVSAFEARIRDFSGQTKRVPDRPLHFKLQPLHRIHMEPGLMWDRQTAADPRMLALWSILGLAVLAMAVINFVNLSTARAASRAHEVGMRKLLGASRHRLAMRFLLESLFLSLLGLAAAGLFARMLLPLLHRISGTAPEFSRLFRGESLLFLAALWLITGLAAGAYPAAVMTVFPPLAATKQRMGPRRGHAFRSVLVIVQFGLTIALLVSTFVLRGQIDYMRSRPLGFEPKQKIILPLPFKALKDRDRPAIKSAFASHPAVEGAALSRGVPGRNMDYAGGRKAESPEDSPRVRIYHMHVDEDFRRLYGIERIAGSGPGPDERISPGQGVFVNQALVRAMGWADPEEAVGRHLRTGHFSRPVLIAGVVRDFHFTGLQEAVGAVMMTYQPQSANTLTLQADTARLAELRPFLERTWRRQFPDFPLEMFFLNEDFNRHYRREENVGRALGGFSLLGVLIACLGLLGLAAFLTEQRTREVGIRKVLGASAPNVVWLLSSDFLKWVAAANLLAWPLAWWAMRRWLDGFAFRLKLTPAPFAAAAALTLLVAAATVSFQTLRAAQRDPADVLRHE